nr:multidrug resistance protein D [uncultured bacterium]
MKRQRNVNLLLMLVLLVAVGQMAQTIYIPAIADMARDLNVREGAVQSVMGAYLLTYGVSQLFYGPISDRVGRRPVILVGMSIFMLATLVAVTTSSLTVLIAASAMQGMGTGVGGVMARTLPRDLYERTQLRHANSLLNMGIAACQRCPAKVVLVTNEVGMGIVPESRLARHFRDIAGRVNQQLAAAANEVWLVVSGIGVKIK